MSDVQKRIADLVQGNEVMLFMKGSRGQPQCGFSAKVVEILDEYLADYRTFDVLGDPEVRQGIKDFSSWPTIPQLYVSGKFVGGSDIVGAMSESGELDTVLGASRSEIPVPEIFLSDAALKALSEFNEGDGVPTVRLEITPNWQYGMDFDQERQGDMVVAGEGWKFVMNRKTARKADGMKIDFVQGPSGAGFKIENPHEPPRVKLLHVDELKTWRDEGKAHQLYDVRMPQEREIAVIEPSTLFDDHALADMEKLDRDTTLVFYCHTAQRSGYAAEHALSLGFKDVYNLAGGIDAWAQDVDPDMKRY